MDQPYGQGYGLVADILHDHVVRDHLSARRTVALGAADRLAQGDLRRGAGQGDETETHPRLTFVFIHRRECARILERPPQCLSGQGVRATRICPVFGEMNTSSDP